ncbi:MAG: hypothetical protein LBO74_14535 [Candidatus Symbiothrix sp.]|jgi:hypothetical protein|nr:hypothetical protein [Candidatus Symbiothrix sp.]
MYNNEILGCYVQIGFDPNLREQDFMNLNESFTPYIWKEHGVSTVLKKMKTNRFFGQDLDLALFQFYVKPTPIELQYLKEIGAYRRKEKSIGIPIIVNDENFFNKSEEDRYNFIKTSILLKMDLLEDVVKKKKLDTNMDLLKKDLQEVLSKWQPHSA